VADVRGSWLFMTRRGAISHLLLTDDQRIPDSPAPFCRGIGRASFVSSLGCNKSRNLVGRYALVPTDRCLSHELKSSHLALHADGTYDQRHELVNGEVVQIVGQQWSYDGNMVKLENFRIVTKPDVRLTIRGAEVQLNAVTSHPQALSFGDSRCVYQGPK
jgi:hypothetical protein